MPKDIDPVKENEEAEREWYERSADKRFWKPTRTLFLHMHFRLMDETDKRFRRVYFLLALNGAVTVLCVTLLLLR